MSNQPIITHAEFKANQKKAYASILHDTERTIHLLGFLKGTSETALTESMRQSIDEVLHLVQRKKARVEDKVKELAAA